LSKIEINTLINRKVLHPYHRTHNDKKLSQKSNIMQGGVQYDNVSIQ